MLNVEYTNQFKRDLKLAKRRSKSLDALSKIMKQIENKEVLDKKFRDHPFAGNWNFHRELHIEADWLLNI